MLIPQYFAGNETDANITDDFEYGLGRHGDRFTTTPLRAPRVTENRLLFPLTLSTPPPHKGPPPQQTQLTLHFRVAIILLNYTKNTLKDASK